MEISLTESQIRTLREIIGSRMVNLSDNIRKDKEYPEYVKTYKVEYKKLERIARKLGVAGIV